MRLYLAIVALFAVFSSLEALPGNEVRGFLGVHNWLRRSISSGRYVARGRRMPAARYGIPNLNWDGNLERDAQHWANRCRFEHSRDRRNQGENLYQMWSSRPLSINGMGRKASISWANEFQQFGWSSIRFNGGMMNVGHATQMAWQRTRRLGCGIARCDGGRKILVVCRYQDAGNWLGQNIYDPR